MQMQMAFSVGGSHYRYENRDPDGAVYGCFGERDLESEEEDHGHDSMRKTIFVADQKGYRTVTQVQAEAFNAVVKEEMFPSLCLSH